MRVACNVQNGGGYGFNSQPAIFYPCNNNLSVAVQGAQLAHLLRFVNADFDAGINVNCDIGNDAPCAACRINQP